MSGTASAEVGLREWSEWYSISRGGIQRVERVEQHRQRGDPESGVSGTASAEVALREWSERNSISRRASQRAKSESAAEETCEQKFCRKSCDVADVASAISGVYT